MGATHPWPCSCAAGSGFQRWCVHSPEHIALHTAQAQCASAISGWPRSASRRASRRAGPTSNRRPKPTSERAPRGGIRYGLRPARLPPREQRCIEEEEDKPGIDLHLSTAGRHAVSSHPRVNIGSAGRSDLDRRRHASAVIALPAQKCDLPRSRRRAAGS